MEQVEQSLRTENLGSRRVADLRMAVFPNADEIVFQGLLQKQRRAEAVDILLVNPPTPDGGLWIRTQHRVGRRTRENMVWPQVSLAQMAALLHPVYSLKIVDANAERMGWAAFTRLLDLYQPRFYLTQVTAPTLENDMYGCFLAKTRGAQTIAFGTHVTPVPQQTLRVFPDLDFVLFGEPDLTIRDLLDHLDKKFELRSEEIQRLFTKNDLEYNPCILADGRVDLHGVKGLGWRDGDEIVLNAQRPFIQDLDDLPIPLHALLPLKKYVMPMIKGPFTFLLTSRGCPAGCTFCIKHVTYQYNVRLRSPEKVMEELWLLKRLRVSNINMYSDLFTVNRAQVMDLCERMIQENIQMKWMCNSRVDFVDQEMLQLMGKAGCWMIAWGIESGDEQILANVHKGISLEKVSRALHWSKQAGIMNWGYFIIGLPGETEASIQKTIHLAKKLPIDIALFHIAAPYPGTPLFFDVVKNGWFKPGTRWEQVDMDKETVLNYPQLSSKRLMYWQKRAWREWAFRPGPIWTYVKMLLSDPSTFTNALSVGLQHLKWQAGGQAVD